MREKYAVKLDELSKKQSQDLENFSDSAKGSTLDTEFVVKTPAGRISRIARPSREVAAMSNDYLRLAAEIYYTTDLNSISIEDLWDVPQFHVIPLYKLQRWSKEYNWIEKRKAFQEKCSNRVQEAVASKLVRIRLDQMERITAICDDMWVILQQQKEKGPKVQSYEGVVKAYLQAVLMMEKLRDSITATIGEKTVNPDQIGSSSGIELTPEEAKIAAIEIVKRRQLSAPLETDLETKIETTEEN